MSATDNTITDASTAAGDILKSNGTKFVRLARGSANQPLKVNSGGTDLDFGTLPVAGGGTGAATLTGIVKASGTSAFTAVTAPSGALLGDSDTQNISGAKTFFHQALKLRNPANTATLTVQNPTITTDQNFEFPYNASYIIYQTGTTIKAKNGVTGAVDYSGDASTDCIPTIQSAIDNVKFVGSDSDIETGAVIQFLRGTYKCITSLELNASRTNARRGVQLRGEGSGTLFNFVPGSTLSYGILIRSDYVSLRDFRIKGNSNTNNLVKAISSTSHFSDRVNIFNCQFQGTNAWASLAPISGQNGIWRDASTAGSIKLYWWKIIGCSFDSLDKGIVGTGGANDTSMQIEACDFYDCTTGIELYANEHVINNVYFQGDLDYGVTGVHVLGTSNENIITNIVHELHKTATNCEGVKLDSGASRNKISNVYSGYNDNNLVVSVRDNSGNGTNVIAPYIYQGAAAVTKPTAATVLTNSLWFETDTRLWYSFDGSAWNLVKAALVGSSGLDFNEFVAKNITEIKASDTSGLLVKGNTDVTSATARNIVFQTLNTSTDTFASPLTINATGPVVSLATTLDINNQPMNNVVTVKGTDTSGIAIRGNTAASAATERSVILQALNASTDTFIDAFSIVPNGASPVVKSLVASDLESYADIKVITIPSDPSSGYVRVYPKATDANTDSLYMKAKLQGAVTEFNFFP